ncbi:membrane protein insertase YidC [Pseudocolwellia sp. AS88]|uniref:membrane protein insertase YidC n=1 Tax=Pseudocolwellia sp. AS88 TaxID=3063958 RepID=UPI0026EC4FBC|nr:membrane protein insertase YidC [Pseudocolwellia sp. AS88]MDO7085129.1 membrane protein insertase YidC [Pseudocolwellia sp. AS88]
MESQRSFLFIALLVVTYLLFSEWQKSNAPAPIVIEQSEQVPTNTIQNANGEYIPESSSNNTIVQESTSPVKQLISVNTDVLALQIDTRGGDIVDAKLLKFDTEQGNGIPFTVMQNGPKKYVAQSGLIGEQGIDRLIAGRPIYKTSAKQYDLADNESLTVDLDFVTEDGLAVTKRFTFNKSSYSINIEYIVKNNTATMASVQMYGQLKQSTLVESGSALMPTYRGAAYSTDDDRYEKYSFDDISETKLNISTMGGWVAMLEHYFVSSWVPHQDDSNQFYSSYINQDAVIGFKAPVLSVQPNTEAVTSAIFYVGPKDQVLLESIAPHLGLTIDYGFLSMISQPLFWLLIKIQSLVSNWGLAIIVITLIVKGGMYPLTKAQYTSMAKMRALAPKMAQLKERFGDDRQKMSQATMEMYRKEKVNPAGGCLPLLVQMPIFLALYWVFLESVELRHAPFMLWIQDLSAQDPFYILPILMGVSMFVMQKMQPMTVQDPMQQKIMQYMPVAFTVFFFWFPSGLVLYWLVSNLISIAQMKIIFSGIEKKKAQQA